MKDINITTEMESLINDFETLKCSAARLKKTINWKHIIKNLKLKEYVLEEFAEELDWNDVFRYQNVSSSFYFRHKFRIL